MEYKYHTNCRVCNSTDLKMYLDLGLLPLSNNLAESADDKIHNQKYPLQVMLCGECGLSQLSIVIPPEVLFSHYVYRSSISQGYINHCRSMAETIKEKYNLTDKSFCIDIAGNDGALLKEFKEVIGCKVLNVDPAKNLYQICEDKGVRMFCTFWGIDAANHIAANWHQKADIITATNVFAHVNDIKGFIEAVKIVLAPTGKLILEFPYLIDFIEKKEFDTVYFEHLSYMSIGPLNNLVTGLGLEIESVERFDIHGGSVRVTIGYGTPDMSSFQFPMDEVKYRRIHRYNDFSQAVAKTLFDFRENLLKLQNVAAFAASAKGNTLLNCAGITNEHLMYIIDETPEKVGKFSPGTRIPILSMEALKNNPPDYLLILSWNFLDEIISKTRKAGYTGKYLVPIPEFKIID